MTKNSVWYVLGVCEVQIQACHFDLIKYTSFHPFCLLPLHVKVTDLRRL